MIDHKLEVILSIHLTRRPLNLFILHISSAVITPDHYIIVQLF